MSDGAVELQKATQHLGIAANAYQGATFCKQFAVKMDLSGLTPEQVAQRQVLLRILGGLIDAEFEEHMDKLVAAWSAYRQVRKR